MTTVEAPPEERVVLRHVRWTTYERLLEDHADQRSPRFTYDRGVLEIMSPGQLHERLADLVRGGEAPQGGPRRPPPTRADP